MINTVELIETWI